MSNKTEANNRIVEKPRRATVLFAGALVVILAIVIGLNVGGLRERLLWRLTTPHIESIAVLPFENLAHDPEQEYLADGITDTLSYDLSLNGTVRVIYRDSVVKYKKAPKPLPEIARELNVAAVVDGGVLRSGNRVKITVHLIYAPANRRLWEQTYERELGDIPTLTADISRDITREIRARVTPQQEASLAAARPVNPQALDAYLRASYGGNPEKAGTYLEQAIQLDPGFAPSYAALASNYYWFNYFFRRFPARDVYPKVKESARKAVSLDPTYAPAHYLLAIVAEEYDWNFVEAEKEFKHNLELRPNCMATHDTYAHFLLSMGRTEEASAETRRALEIDPTDPGLIECVAWHDVTMGHYEEAEKHSLQARSMGMRDGGSLNLAWSYEQRHLFDKAIPEFQKVVVGTGGWVQPTAALGHAYAAAGKEQEAREVLDRLLARSQKEYVSAYEIATIYAGLGDRDRAFEWLEKAYEERSDSLVHFRMDPRLLSLRSDARFRDLLRRMNFPS